MPPSIHPAQAFADASAQTLDLLARPEVAAAWDGPSALPEWSVAGLAGHLAGQAFSVRDLVAATPSGEMPIALTEHYRRAAWTEAAVDDDVSVSIRAGGDAQAAAGHADLVARTHAARDEAVALLGRQDAGRAVWVPWQGWALTLDDFVTTRLMEMTVHGDDLTESVGLPPLVWPDHVVAPVFALLTAVAAQKHGQAAVLRTLARVERAPGTVAAF